MFGLQGQIRASRIRVSRVNSVSGAKHRGSQPSGPKPGLNPDNLLVGCRQSKAGLVTDHAWAPGAKLRFLGLGFLRLTQTQVPDTKGGSLAGRNLA